MVKVANGESYVGSFFDVVVLSCVIKTHHVGLTLGNDTNVFEYVQCYYSHVKKDEGKGA